MYPKVNDLFKFRIGCVLAMIFVCNMVRICFTDIFKIYPSIGG